MKKKNFIIGGAAALCAIASVGTSFALYLVAPSAISGDITVSSNADVNYAINLGEAKLNPISPNKENNNNSTSLNFKIHGERDSTSAFQQPFVSAKLTITITPTIAPNQETGYKALTEYLTVSGNVGYKANTYFANNNSTINFSTADATTGVITGTLSTYIYVGGGWDADPSKATPDYNPVNLSILYDVDGKEAPTGADFVKNYAEASYTVDINLTADDVDYPFIVGSMNGWTSGDDAYAMVKNINAENNEWMWLGNLPSGTEVKANIPEGDVWSTGNNLVVAEGKTLTGLYWDGEGQALRDSYLEDVVQP